MLLSWRMMRFPPRPAITARTVPIRRRFDQLSGVFPEFCRGSLRRCGIRLTPPAPAVLQTEPVTDGPKGAFVINHLSGAPNL